MDEDLIEKKLRSERIFTGKLLHVNRDVVELPNGKEASREWIEHPGASAVIPVLPDGKIVMVRQFRYPIGQITLEIPAGKLDAPEEDPLFCAQRELKEETGYTASGWEKLGSIATTVGFSNEYIHLYAARELVAGKQSPDEDEFINTVTLSLTEAVRMVASGEIYDAKSVTAILLLKNKWQEK